MAEAIVTAQDVTEEGDSREKGYDDAYSDSCVQDNEKDDTADTDKERHEYHVKEDELDEE